MSEGQRWLWHMHNESVRMHADSKQWLLEAGLPLPPALVMPPFHLMEYWQRSGQFERAVAYKPNSVPPPYMHREQVNKCPPPLPTYLAE